MGKVSAEVERIVAAKTDATFAFLSDYRRRGEILTPEFVGYAVEEAGPGGARVVSYTLRAGRRERAYRLRVEESVPQRQLKERDTGSSLVTTWDVEPAGNGERTRVRLRSEWQGAGGIGGVFERAFAPAALRRIYARVLDNLAGALSP